MTILLLFMLPPSTTVTIPFRFMMRFWVWACVPREASPQSQTKLEPHGGEVLVGSVFQVYKYMYTRFIYVR